MAEDVPLSRFSQVVAKAADEGLLSVSVVHSQYWPVPNDTDAGE